MPTQPLFEVQEICEQGSPRRSGMDCPLVVANYFLS